MTSYIIVNGNVLAADKACISAFDRGLTLGHGLFETMLLVNGYCPLLSFHWRRLVFSAKLLGIKLPFDLIRLKELIVKLIGNNQSLAAKAVIRLTITDGIAERGILSDGKQCSTYILTIAPFFASLKQSMTATIVSTRRNEHSLSAQIKSISYLDNILAKQEASTRGFDEAFLLNSKLDLAEGAISNVFIVANDVIYTPPIIDGALPGVMRHVILNKLPLEQIQIKEQSIDKKMLFAAEEIFISNALFGIKSIHQLDHYYYSSFTIAEYLAKLIKTKFLF